MSEAPFDVMWLRIPERQIVRVNGIAMAGQVGVAAYLASLGHEVVCPEHRFWSRGSQRQSDKSPVRLVRRPLWPGYLPVRWACQIGMGGQENGPSADVIVRRWMDTAVMGWGRSETGSPWTMPALEAQWWRNWRHKDLDEAGARFQAGDIVRAIDQRFDGHRLKIRFSRPSKRGGWEYIADTPPMLGVLASITIHENELALPA